PAIERAPNASFSRGIDALAVRFADHQFVDVVEILVISSRQPHPMAPGIRGFKDAQAAMRARDIDVVDRTDCKTFARSGIDHIWIYRIEHKRADRDIGKQIANWRPRDSGIG